MVLIIVTTSPNNNYTNQTPRCYDNVNNKTNVVPPVSSLNNGKLNKQINYSPPPPVSSLNNGKLNKQINYSPPSPGQ